MKKLLISPYFLKIFSFRSVLFRQKAFPRLDNPTCCRYNVYDNSKDRWGRNFAEMANGLSL